MVIGTVIGSVWATKKADGINGHKMLIVDLINDKNTMKIQEKKEKQKEILVAADVIGAGIGDMVLICQGSSARLAVGNGQPPIDAAVVGIVDSLDIHEK